MNETALGTSFGAAAPAAAQEPELAAFLAGRTGPAALRLRTLAHAWMAGGGRLACGKHLVRLVAFDGVGRSFTGATLHGEPARLEIARVLLQSHGVDGATWRAWSDERPELVAYGFDPAAKFPAVDVAAIPDAALARLATGLRDLAIAASRHAAQGQGERGAVAGP